MNAAPGLRIHFHDEIQVTIVLAGVRAFRVLGQEIVLNAGQCIVFPARVPHQPLPTQSPTACLNAYLHPLQIGLGRRVL
ncbi:cupin domain-containing protein [Beijerinckia sp. L45]|uniref:cupin domain-containing protein n=1 Tax=Beijerinckia sp. L45 TaxID=1641855 RepID=UPI00131A784E